MKRLILTGLLIAFAVIFQVQVQAQDWTKVKGLAAQLAKKIDTTDMVDATSYFYTKPAIDSMQVTPFTGGVIEAKARIANQNTAYAGTVRNVPGTYTTITAAYTAAANGDIIQLADGDYDLPLESGGYLMFNTAAKGVLVRGNLTNRNAVRLIHTGASYGVRLRDCAAMTFESVTFQSSGTYGPFLMDQAYSANWVKFKNCDFNQTSTGAYSVFGRSSLTSDTDVIWLEFDGCNITSSGTLTPVVYTNSGVNETILFTGCTITCTGLGTGQPMIFYTSAHKGTFAMYDCVLTNGTNITTCQFGEDENVPTNTTFKIDFRGNTIRYTGSFVNHALLLGRGTNKVYAVNNTIYVPSSSNTLAAGIVLKTTATAVNDAYVAGNKVTAPRPLVLKGAQNTLVKYNTFETNYPASFYGIDIQNPAADRISTSNVIRYNNVIGGLAALGTYDSASWEDPETTIKGWDVNWNRYYSPSGTWLLVSGVSKSITNRRAVYDNSNDAYSKIVSSKIVKVADAPVYDATTTLSW